MPRRATSNGRAARRGIGFLRRHPVRVAAVVRGRDELDAVVDGAALRAAGDRGVGPTVGDQSGGRADGVDRRRTRRAHRELLAVEVVLHGDLGGRHVGPDLDHRLARDALGALRLEQVLGLEQGASAAHARAVDDRRAQRVELADAGVVDGLRRRRHREPGEAVGAVEEPLVDPVAAAEALDAGAQHRLLAVAELELPELDPHLAVEQAPAVLVDVEPQRRDDPEPGDRDVVHGLLLRVGGDGIPGRTAGDHRGARRSDGLAPPTVNAWH